jgi:hypothetical protein
MKRYRVTGSTAYAGHEPGAEFEADLDPDAERRAIARGSLKLLRTKKPEEEAADDE